MMAATTTRPGREAEAGGSKAQLAPILAFCSRIAGITNSARTDGALNARLGAETELNDEDVIDTLRGVYPNGKCRFTQG
jgi:hypothetical protein